MTSWVWLAVALPLAGFTSGSLSLTGHTEWVDGKVHETGFTTAFGPNAKTLISSSADPTPRVGDYISCKERRTTAPCDSQPTYAAVTARSYHTSIVQVLLMDGSCRAISENIDLLTWRGLSTRHGGEVLGEF